MRKLLTLLVAVLLTVSVFAQSPQKMSYQAVIRNSSNALVTNTQVGMQISILQGSSNGTVVYTESQTPTTNINGLVSIEIGGGAGFSSIDWANDIYFIKTETDPTGGVNYTITGTSQLLSVPYALHAKTAETITGTISESDPIFNSSVAVGITETDTTYWNNKSDFDNNYSNLTNAPDIANSKNEKIIQLNTNDATSSVNITKNNGTSVFKVDGTGRMAGNGSGLSNVVPKIGYAQGNQSVYFHEGMISGLNLYEAQIMREVTINCPGPGIILAMASGYARWESKQQDLIRIWFHPHPTVSPSDWETPDFHNLRILDDYGCTDSSDVYTSWSISKVYTVSSAQNFTAKVCADKPFEDSKVLVGDVAMQLLFFPIGETEQAKSVSIKKEEVFALPKISNSLTGE
ncbi:MAG: hypothetical protein M0P26_07550 [Bacteroidales bacterium]|nr:hypothetical protein [Bacteroidales bacterium]